MDPNATLQRIEDSKGAEAGHACDDLHAWILMGGFEPTWADFPNGTNKYRKLYGPS